MYDEYILINAACERNVRPTSIATLADKLPSASAADAPGARSALDARSRAGKKLSRWKLNNDSRPPKTIFLSVAGITVSLFDVPRTLTGAHEGWM